MPVWAVSMFNRVISSPLTMKVHEVRTYKSAEHLPREEQLAWKMAAVATDPVAVQPEVEEMIGNRIIDNASVAVASLARGPAATARAQALAHPVTPAQPCSV